MRKLTLEEVKNLIEVESQSGCKLLSTEYKTNNSKLQLQCSCGNLFETTWSIFSSKKKHHCNDCGRQQGVKDKKYTYDEVKKYIEEESHSGCVLLSDTYNGVKAKLIVKCSCGNNFETTFDAFKNGKKQQCNECGKIINSDKRRLSYQFVKQYIEENSDCKLISEKFTTITDWITLRCKCGELFNTTFTSFKAGKIQCDECTNISIVERLTLPYDLVKTNVESIDGYTLISKEYKGSRDKLEIQCPEGHVFFMAYANFFHNGYRCTKCYTGNIKRTQEEFEQLVFDNTQDEYAVIGKYYDANTKIRMKHNKCGYEWDTTPALFLGNNSKKGSRCPRCIGRFKNADEYKYMLEKKFGNRFQVMSKYSNRNNKIKIKDTKCEHEWWVLPHIFLKSGWCPKCDINDICKAKTHEQFIKEFNDLVGDEYVALSHYINNSTKIKIRHNNETCNNFEYLVTPGQFLQGHRCPKCMRPNHDRDTKQFKQEVFILANNEYTVISEYIGMHRKVKFRHNSDKCRHSEFLMTPNAFYRGQRCPVCKESKGERAIHQWLDNMGIMHVRQYTFEDCKYKQLLRFDFAIFDNSNTLIYLIEYQGEQHYKPIDRFGGIEALEDLRVKDEIKKQYCIQKSMNLIEIPYWEYKNINRILNDELNNII